MNSLDELKIKRFKIIEPFLKKEKKLKDIENETGISYATLKRWTKSYKENGLFGLEKKEREDKNSFKVIDQEGISIIKDLCSKENESNISKLYESCKNTLKEKDYNISYPTFYRILNNLDGFFKKSVSFHLNKIKKSNEIFSVIEMPISIFVQSTKVVVPSVLLLFDLSDLKIIHYSLNTDPTNIYSILGFIKEALLKLSILENKLIKPKEILIDSENNTISKSISKEIFNKTNIKISNYTSYDEEIKKFANLLNEDLNKNFFDKDKIFLKKDVEDFLNPYIYLDNQDYNFELEFNLIKNCEFSKEFDVLLQSTTRKISASSFRFKNIIFKSNILKSLEGQEVELKFNPLDQKKIYIFFKNQFYDLITT
ncbi:Mu transposase C-terminal domain-containing protein [Fusobacterium sp.]|uniref:Mu transposase C-terminal domain-containing protein n=1 Tax=Fusobacterium sp. TaxID=68766 RepID=UPI00261558C4|nr:Mu transposase C-terminal domain-containing protein [Fusobacterium sp.]